MIVRCIHGPSIGAWSEGQLHLELLETGSWRTAFGGESGSGKVPARESTRKLESLLMGGWLVVKGQVYNKEL